MEMKAILDTNVLIDYLSGYKEAEKEISLYREPAISIISWMEVWVGVDKEEEPIIQSFLSSFEIVQVSLEIAEEAIALRKKFKLKLPDAIIWASATHKGLTLVTRNTKDFKASFPGIRIPYSLK
jgi:predicted nucleic acid-binding protein